MAKEMLNLIHSMTLDLSRKLQGASYEDLEEFVDTRGVLIENLQLQVREIAVLNPEQQNMLKNILKCDAQIMDKMQKLREEAANWLEHKQHMKKRSQAYDFLYHSSDSYFLDYRK